MKSCVKRVFFLSVILVLCATASALAQHAGMSDKDVAGTATEKVSAPGEDVRFVPQASGVYAPTDSIALQPLDFPMKAAQRPAEKSNEKQPGKKDDSILTYNFLYYIIQKYKLQDIID